MSGENQEALPEEATQTDPPLGSHGRKAFLRALSISFRAQAQEARWRKLIRALGINLARREDGAEHGVFTAFPAKLQLGSPMLLGSVTLFAKHPGTAHWSFSWGRAGDTTPPEDMLASSRAVGGFPGVLESLAPHWPVAKKPLEARVEATYVMFNDDYRFRFSSMRPKRVRSHEPAFRLMPTRWELSPPLGPVSEIIKESYHKESAFALTGKGEYTFHWSPRFLNELDGALWGGLKTFLENR